MRSLTIIERDGRVEGMECVWTRHDGTPVHMRENARAIRDDNGKCLFYDGTVEDITDRKKGEEKIKMLLAEKELLLHEVHHRIKNNMTTMMSMLSLQANAMEDPVPVAALNDARRRMQSMMVLYDKLYRSIGFRELSVKEYLVPLVHEIVGNFPNSEVVAIEAHVDDFILDQKTALSARHYC
jgi:two-component sensor histidine kinase